jgi:UDP-2,3-diacylglucosamine pyrophosphatase LpxH
VEVLKVLERTNINMSYKFLFLISLSLTATLAKSQYTNPPVNDTSLIAFSSDTQAPMWVETLWLKKTNNKTATRNLFSDIANRRPGSLFILGDVVNLGSSNKQWRPMDKYLGELRSEGINVYAALGNHEVMGNTGKGERKFQQRFPQHCPTGYVEVKDSIAVVLLNSNFNKLSPIQNEVQEEWYKNTLARLDADPAIQFIITGCHHSPYTNSKIVKPSTEVQERFVPAFLQSAKSRLFISGHCHGFEHFKVEGKDFLVIGGGGGLHQPLKTGDDITPDLAADYKPLFHYLTVKRKGGQLELTSYKIRNDYNSFDPGLAFEVEKTDARTVKSTTKTAD